LQRSAALADRRAAKTRPVCASQPFGMAKGIPHVFHAATDQRLVEIALFPKVCARNGGYIA
jgi:hypothetical protein